jgi:hypothetical protein
MTIDRILIAFMIVTGTAVGVVPILWPQAREFRLSPYFWVLIALGVFELINFARGRGAPGTLISIEARLLGFVIAIVLMIVIPLLVGPLLAPR